MALVSGSAQSDFQRGFRALAAHVHRRRALRRALSYAGVGLSLGAIGALGLWGLRLGQWRPFAAGLGLIGAALGLVFANRKRWSDSDVALYLDARLGSHETLVTAL